MIIDISAVGLPALGRGAEVAPTAAPSQYGISTNEASNARSADTVELSAAGRRLADAVELSSLRLAKIRAVREEIEAGTYETPERIRGTVQRMLDIVG